MNSRLTRWAFFLGCLFSLQLATGQVLEATSTSEHSVFPLMYNFLEKARAAGAEFPKPYGISGSMYFQRMRMEIEKVQVGNLLLDPEDGIINFADSEIKNTVVSQQIRADIWVLPFVNLYAMAGRVTTFNDIRLKVNLNAPPIPGLPPGDIPILERQEIANINGTVVGMGTVLAGGYKNIFANVNLTYAKTYLDEVQSFQTSWVAFPMVGVTTGFADLFVGAIYQNNGQVNKGVFTGSNGETIPYTVNYRSKLWNYTVGFNKSIGNWSVVLIQGFGPRVNSVLEIGYRFGH